MLRALVEHGLKLSPKKCQFFRDELVYMGNIFKTSNDGITITPIKTRQEAILTILILNPHYSQRIQKLLWSCELCESILPPFTIFISTNL